MVMECFNSCQGLWIAAVMIFYNYQPTREAD
jgi:hypothetical protein